MKFFKRIFLILIILVAGLNLFILATGRFYLYKGISNTYLKGRSGPSIDEYEIFSNRKVTSGKPQPWPVKINSAEIPVSSIKKFSDLQTIAYLIIRNDSIRFEKYWEDYSVSSVTNSFSMAKTWVSILVGAAIRDGKIQSADQPVSDFLPGFKDGKGASLKIRHLLTMSSGIDFDEDYVSPFAYPAQAYYGDDLKELTYRYKVVDEPGKVFYYLSGNTALLAFILEKATGKSLSDYASEKLWKPMGAEHPAFWSLDHENGTEKAYCCFNSNARDFARFGKLYLDSGRWNGIQLVPEDYALESVKPADLMLPEGRKNDLYGFSWWLTKFRGRDVFYARGILGQYVIVVPSEEMIIVRLGRLRDTSDGSDHPKDLQTWLETAFEIEKIN